MDDIKNNNISPQDSVPTDAQDMVNINVPEIPAITEDTPLPEVQSVDISVESTVEPMAPEMPEKATADNIIFTPEDYQKMTGQPEDDSWQPTAPAVMSEVQPLSETGLPQAEAEISQPQIAEEVVQEPQTVFAPVPTLVTEHYEEQSAIPNPESFYVGYNPNPPAPVAPTGLEKRINEVSAEQAAKNKKLVITVIAAVVGTLLIGGGSVFGFVMYQKSMSQKVLTSAWENLGKMTEVSTAVSLGYADSSVEATFDVDKDSDMRFKIDVREFPLELVYINKSDKLYIYDIATTTQATTATTTTKSWIEVSNTKKAIQNYVEKNQTSMTFSTQNIFNKENAKYFKKEADQMVDGTDSYKYVFNPPAEVLNEALGQAEDQEALKSLGLKADSLKLEMWIGKKDSKFTKLKATYGLNFGVAGSEQAYTGNLELKFKYNYKEDIKTSTRTKISQKIDLSKQLNELMKGVNLFGSSSSGELNAADTSNIALLRQLQNSLEQYFVDNNKYPNSQDATGLVSALAGDGLIDSSFDVSEFKYTHTTDPEGYMLMFKLVDQTYSGENVVGESPDKYYVLTAKQ